MKRPTFRRAGCHSTDTGPGAAHTGGSQGVADSAAETEGNQDHRAASDAEHSPPEAPDRRGPLQVAVAAAVLPGIALLMGVGAGYLKWHDSCVREAAAAGQQAVQAASEGTVAILSYKPETVQKDLDSARQRLTGNFLNAYTSLTHDLVIPGSQERHVSAVATVPAAASTSATPTHAVVLLFVNQSITIGTDAPTTTASSVRVTLDKVGQRWLISQFEPV